MTKLFDSFRLMFARTRRCLHLLALGFHAVNDVLDPVLEQFTRRPRPIRRRCLRSLMNRRGLCWNVYCVANVVLRKQLNLQTSSSLFISFYMHILRT